MAYTVTSIEGIIGRIAGEHAVMDEAAEKVRAKATALAAADRRTGEYSNNFKVAKVPSRIRGVVQDRVVYNDHPHAIAIEIGHEAPTTRGYARFVPGKYYLLKATRGH